MQASMRVNTSDMGTHTVQAHTHTWLVPYSPTYMVYMCRRIAENSAVGWTSKHTLGNIPGEGSLDQRHRQVPFGLDLGLDLGLGHGLGRGGERGEGGWRHKRRQRDQAWRPRGEDFIFAGRRQQVRQPPGRTAVTESWLLRMGQVVSA